MARTILQGGQKRWADRLGASPLPDPVGTALARWQDRIDTSEVDGNAVLSGPFRYRLDLEQLRWARTREIIERAQPGPFEDGGYLEFLARQAAGVELILAHPALALGDEVPSVVDGILLGTTGEPTSAASTQSLPGSRAAVIQLSAGMVYLMYQSAKSVVTAWKVIHGEKGPAFVARPEDVAAVLDADPTAADQLLSTLTSWFLDGQPRPPASAAPPPVYTAPLTLLINFAERFVIAHEYCHALYDQFRLTPPPWLPPLDGGNQIGSSHSKEMRCDYFAAVVVGLGAMELDQMAPNMALQGAVLALKVHEIADDAIRQAIRTPVAANSTHPPFDQRLDRVFAAYHERFDVAGRPDLADDPMRQAADTAAQLWQRVGPRLGTALQDRPRHPIWS